MRLPYATVIFAVIFLFLSFPFLSYPKDAELEKVVGSYKQAVALYNQGRYQEAIPIVKEVLAILEKAFGPDNTDIAISLNQLALIYKSMGEYAKAEPLYKRSLAIYEKAMGPNHPHVATSLNNLAELYRALGEYEKAEPLYKRSLHIRENTLGPGHTDVANSLNNLAILYYSIGDYVKAEPLYKQSLVILENALGPEHPDVAGSIGNLASLYYSLGKYAKAEPLYQRSLAIHEKALGPDHPDVATSLNNLAELYVNLGDYEKAEPLYKRALAINELALGPDHPQVATVLNNLASLYYSLGDYVNAKQLWQRALIIYENSFGTNNPLVANSLNNLAVLYAAKGNIHRAHELQVKAQQIDGKLIDQVIGFTSEDQKMKFLSIKKGDLYRFVSLVELYLSQDPSAIKDALDVWLSRKGIILEAQKRFQDALVYSDDPQVVKTFQELSRVRAQLSKLAFSSPGKAGPKAYKKEISRLENKKSRLEVRLSNLSKSFALKQKVSTSDSLKVASVLPKNTALLEFSRIGKFNFKAKGKKKKWLGYEYIAFVLHPGQGDRPDMVNLGDAEEIDRAVALLKKEIIDSKDIKNPNMTSASKKLYKLVFEPLLKKIGKKKEIFISPDGNLNLMPFEVLQRPDESFLIEKYTFNYLAAGRDIVGFGKIKGKRAKALLIGDPDFNLGEKEKDSSIRELALRNVENTEVHIRSLDMRGFHFNRLPGTREEVRTIQELLGRNNADVYTGNEALEEVLKQTVTPSILHLATHGFFLNDSELQDFADDDFNRGIAVHFNKASPKLGKGKIKIKNPLLRSGVALAGANNALKTNNALRTDGIVTAEKILGLKLRGTDMVVLSACDTGAGEVKTGEGVFGLRRAFTQAGTKSLVMSMWSVPDKETKELMVNFYRNIKTKDMTRSKSLRQAALKQIKIVKKRYGHTNPFYWGAFVFMGEP